MPLSMKIWHSPVDLRIWISSNCTPKSLKFFRGKPDGDPCRMPPALTLQRKNRKPAGKKLHGKSNKLWAKNWHSQTFVLRARYRKRHALSHPIWQYYVSGKLWEVWGEIDNVRGEIYHYLATDAERWPLPINIGRYIHRSKKSIIHQRSMPKQSRNKWKLMTKSYREAHQVWANNGRWTDQVSEEQLAYKSATKAMKPN